ncbi:MAG TPA: metalloregulator ArsR/SmtB family transcription factor [Burkholderiaceae bacterium]|jgi:ArsR family transcriptional regulator
MTDTSVQAAAPQLDRVYEIAAELFSLMSAPIRLKIISSLCAGEKTVSDLLGEIETTQPNMSQHLSQLYRAGVLARKRAGQQMIYSINNERAAMLCRAVCTQIAIEIDDPDAVSRDESLLPQRG